MSVLSEIYSPTFHHRRTKKTHMTKVRLALSRVAVQYHKNNKPIKKMYVKFKSCKILLSIHQNQTMVLGINTHDLVQDEAQEEHDLAIVTFTKLMVQIIELLPKMMMMTTTTTTARNAIWQY